LPNSDLNLPPGATVRLRAIGAEALLVIAPPDQDPDARPPLQRAEVAALIVLDPGCIKLDRAGAALINATLAAGDFAFIAFLGGLRDALAFQFRLESPPEPAR
jgi:hypothetical protein